MNTPQSTMIRRAIFAAVFALLLTLVPATFAQFTHPGGLHNQADLDRMKTQVAAGAQPWLAGWNRLITDPQAQSSYTPAASANMGANRQRASQDAHAAYLNAIRGYVTNDMAYIDKAIQICNVWSAAVNQVPTGTDIPGLVAIPIYEFALVGEILRIYVPSRWATADFNRFKTMMTTYLYPVCNDFLTNHNGRCISYYWANWDAANIGAVMAIGILCDDTAKFNQAVTYYQSGAGTGSIMNAAYFMHPGNLAQWQESGRDQEHAQLGVGLLATVCEVAWKQGVDLYGYSSNRLLAGAEYTALFNLSRSVPYTFYDNCQPSLNKWASLNGRGRLDDRPVWEVLYNHYVVRQGLSAPNTTAMAKLMRPEHGSADHFGYGTLTFTLGASTYPPSATPPVPSGLAASAGVGRVFLKWNASSGDTANGFEVRRATASGGPYTTLAALNENTTPAYTDTTAANGTTYYYVVAAKNQAGTSGNSSPASAAPAAAGALPSGWSYAAIGSSGGSGTFANVSGGSYLINSAAGTDVGGTADSFGFLSRSITGDATITVRLLSNGSVKGGIMMREGTAANARMVTMTLGEAGGRCANLRTRTTAGGSATTQLGNQYTWVPAWFRLQRTGNVFTAFESVDGANWFAVGSASTVAMGSTYQLGLALVSGTATFDNVTVTGGSSLPSPWVTADVGAVGATGSASHSSGTFSVAGSGADIWVTADEFRYVYQTASGDCSITARIDSVQNTHAAAKGGVMIRESLNANSAHALANLTPNGVMEFIRRTSTGGSSAATSATGLTFPHWVRVTRVGNTFTSYRSTNGTTWTSVGSATITMATTVYIGLACTSHADGTLCTTTFTNVTAVP